MRKFLIVCPRCRKTFIFLGKTKQEASVFTCPKRECLGQAMQPKEYLKYHRKRSRFH